jgi:hypothetical protein
MDAPSLLLFRWRDLVSHCPELFVEPLGLAESFHLERNGVNRLLQVLDALIGHLLLRWRRFLTAAPGRDQPADVSHEEKRSVADSMRRLAHRDGESRAAQIDQDEKRYDYRP